MNNSLIGPFLPSIWKDLVYGRLNIEDLAMLRRVCRFFRDDKRLNGMLDSLKEMVFNKNVYFPQPILFNLKHGNKLGCYELKMVDISKMRNKYKDNIHYMMVETNRFENRIYFFTSKDIMIKIIKNNCKYWKYRHYIMTDFIKIDFIYIDIFITLYIWGLENIFIKNNLLYLK